MGPPARLAHPLRGRQGLHPGREVRPPPQANQEGVDPRHQIPAEQGRGDVCVPGTRDIDVHSVKSKQQNTKKASFLNHKLISSIV